MCGIAGLYSFQNEEIEKSLLERMNRLMTHRGPDEEGYFYQRGIGLAMRRLKVIDLSTGSQPIYSDDKNYCIVFNGEIYNYRILREALIRKGHTFHTHSDTEVILHQYMEEGEKGLDALVGMFAFAIYDARKKSLFIARDRLGVKPLFYHASSKGIVFGSEIKTILESPWVQRKMDLQSISHYLSLNYLPDVCTPFEGIKQLLPGHWMRVAEGKFETRQYWEIPLGKTGEDSEEAALKKIEELLHRSIERRLISDVPVGAFLSGGLDSSTLVALMKEHKHEAVKTFSVGFNDPSYDETPYAKEVASFFGTDHYEIRCSAQDVEDSLSQMTWHADNLLADQAALPLYKVSKLAKQHVTVVLSGDGGDEVFVGYPTFHANRYHSFYSKVPAFIRKNLVESLVGALPASSAKLSFDYKAKKFVEAGDLDPEKAHYWWRTIFTEREKKELLQPQAFSQITHADAFQLYKKYFDEAHSLDFMSRCLFADQKVWLPGNNLYKVDTMTMAHGLEARVPFLDHELVEYMAHLPFHLKYRGNVLKYLLKKIVRSKLPPSIFQRKKAGWHAPIAGWFRGPLREYTHKLLLRNHPILDEILSRPYVARMLDEHVQGRKNHGFKLWSLLVLHHWADRFFVI